MRDYSKVNRKAPRCRFHRHSLITYRGKTPFYDDFYKEFPEYTKIKPEEINNIIYTFNKNLYTAIVDNRDGVELFEKMGNLFIGTCYRPKKANPDRKISELYGKEIMHTNLPSDSYLAKIFYTNNPHKFSFPDRELWKFEGCRGFTTLVGRTYPIEWKKYHIIDNFKHISDLYRKRRNRLDARKEPIPTVYNEFDI